LEGFSLRTIDLVLDFCTGLVGPIGPIDLAAADSEIRMIRLSQICRYRSYLRGTQRLSRSKLYRRIGIHGFAPVMEQHQEVEA
jgi:hypothetical protein